MFLVTTQPSFKKQVMFPVIIPPSLKKQVMFLVTIQPSLKKASYVSCHNTALVKRKKKCVLYCTRLKVLSVTVKRKKKCVLHCTCLKVLSVTVRRKKKCVLYCTCLKYVWQTNIHPVKNGLQKETEVCVVLYLFKGPVCNSEKEKEDEAES